MKTISLAFSRKKSIFFLLSAPLTGITYFACQNPAVSNVQSQDSVQFVQVQQADFFAVPDTIPAAGIKWFKKGFHYAAKGNTAQAKACYEKARLNGYPVSREYLMPVGL